MRIPTSSEPARHSEQQFALTEEFAKTQKFQLDPFQVAGCEALENGKSVLVAAPTGAGKTVVGEFAVHLAMRTSTEKAFYTTPMKALSNQKFRELVAIYGADNVGLLTGDTSINGNARIVVMTTEVLRNMLYASSATLDDLRYVVMDEVHYLADRFRGPVWEEVILHLADSVRLVCLSATVSNAEEFGDWLDTVRGDTAVIVSEVRPVPLEQHVLVEQDLVPLFDPAGARGKSAKSTARVNPALLSLGTGNETSGRYRHRAPRIVRADRTTVVELLEHAHLLPAIFFIFSRAGCDAAVQQVRRTGLSLTSELERKQIRQIIKAHTKDLAEEDLNILGFWRWRKDAEAGVAAHHAGLIPVFKEAIEELFQKKLVKAVFATETLALGINMPARTVVLEKLEKFNGQARVPITPGEYTQITGRAGRRGIDVEGHAVIQWTPALNPHAVAALASRRTYPLNSSFRPTYNMTVNLIDRVGREVARDILESSFAQFQADRAVVGLATEVREAENSMVGFSKAMQCDLGDFLEYSRLRHELTELERGSKKGSHRSANSSGATTAQRNDLRTKLRMHPAHDCPDREAHARWGERYWKLHSQTARIRKQINRRTGSVARRFDRIINVLAELNYVTTSPEDTRLTDAGKTMRYIYGERDLLIAEALRRGLWKSLDAPGLAAMACAVVYEPRRSDTDSEYRLPTGSFREVWSATTALWEELEVIEQANSLEGTEPLQPGISGAMHAWARGVALERVLLEHDLAAGDFVRWVKQTVDVLDQLANTASDAELAKNSRRAVEKLRRGIVVAGAL